MAGNILDLTEETFQAEVLDSTVPVIVDFWAEWCGPCRAMGPILEQLAQTIGPAAKVAKLNVDHARNLSINYNVNSIPTIIIFKAGQPQKQFVGLTSLQDLQKAVAEIAG